MTSLQRIRSCLAGGLLSRASRSGSVAILAAMLLSPAGALAQAPYPEKPVRILLGFPAGTAPDIIARLVADKMQPRLGQPVVVEHAVGAGGNIAAARVAKAAPDGHTLLLAGNAAIVSNQHLYENLPYDPVRDLAPISQVAMTPNILVVHPDVPAKTVQELAALARSQPDALTYAHAGIGISQHLAGELFNQMAGVAMRPVAYKGGNLIFPDLLAGRVNVCFCNIATTLPLVREGKLRALAVTARQRSSSAPDLPTMEETGFSGFEATAWFALMAPAGTPVPVIERLHREVAAALAAEDVRKRFGELGMVAIGNTPTQFASVIQAEIPYWEKVIKAIGLKLQ